MLITGNPAVDAELAYRREVAQEVGRSSRTRRPRRRWLRRTR